MSHNCPVIVFTCIDFRLHPELEELMREKYGSFDLCVTAGGVKGLSEEVSKGYLLEQIKISKKLHNSRAVALTAHRDCGAYGGSAVFSGRDDEIAHHAKVLNRAALAIKDAFPDLKIELFFIELEEISHKWRPALTPVSLDSGGES